MILPRVKSQTKKSGTWTPSRVVTYSVAAPDAFGAKAMRAMAYFLPDHLFVPSENAEIVLTCLHSAPHPEWYSLRVSEKGAKITYDDALGAVHAMASLAQLVLDGSVGACEIEDYPDYGFRGLMLDLARGLREPLQDVKDIIVHMALCKYNYLHLHLQDAESLCFQSDVLKKLSGSESRRGRQYTKDQLRDLVSFADIFSIEIIPEIEVPAHATDILRHYPEFRCNVDPVEHTSLWCVCPAHEGLFELYDRLIGEVAEIFPGKFLHIGGDELEFREIDELNRFCYWRICPDCQKLREEKGLADIREEYYYVIERIHEIVKSHGKITMMWNEQIDIAKECPLPKDIFIEWWRVAWSKVGPKEGCSMEGFARQGYHFINSFFQQTYIDFDRFFNEEKLSTWTPVSEPELYDEGHKYVHGSELSAWEYGNREVYGFYDYTIQPTLPLFADRLWCADPVSFDKEYRRDVYKIVFGKLLQNEPYPIFGAIVPPRKRDDDALTYLPYDEIDRDYVADVIEELSMGGTSGIYAKMRYEYVKLLQRITVEQFRQNEEAARKADAAADNIAIANNA